MKGIAEIVFKGATVKEVMDGEVAQRQIGRKLMRYSGILSLCQHYEICNRTDVRWWLEIKKCKIPTVCELQHKGQVEMLLY